MPVDRTEQAVPDVTEAADHNGLTLDKAAIGDIDQLMSWFEGEQAVCVWGGPGFRFPFSRETFHEDVRWREMASYCVHDAQRRFVAFGQFYNRFDRINFARLIVHPDARGRGLGKELLGMLMSEARPLFELVEYSLFVFRNNAPALACYESMGFVIRDYPAKMPMADTCYYLTRPVAAEE